MDILKRLEKVMESTTETPLYLRTAKDLVKKLKHTISHHDSPSRFFDARLHRLPDEFDESVLIIKFACALKNDDHKTIMKEAPTKFMIAVHGFDRKGIPNGHNKCELISFNRLKNIDEGRGEFNEVHEKHKVTKEGTLEEVGKHLIKYIKENIKKFTDMTSVFRKQNEKLEEVKEDAGAGTASNSVAGGTQSDVPAETSDGIDQDSMTGISRFKSRWGEIMTRKKKKKK